MHTSIAVLLKRLLLTMGVFFGVVFCGILLMFLVYALPTEHINIHVRESGISLQLEGNYWYMLPHSSYTVLDNYTDAMMLLTAAYDHSGVNLPQRAVENRHIVINNATIPESCALLDSAEEMGYSLHIYARYWHGYLVYLKPFLMFLNLDEIRQLNWLCVMGAAM